MALKNRKMKAYGNCLQADREDCWKPKACRLGSEDLRVKFGIACDGVAERAERSSLMPACETEAMCRCGWLRKKGSGGPVVCAILTYRRESKTWVGIC